MALTRAAVSQLTARLTDRFGLANAQQQLWLGQLDAAAAQLEEMLHDAPDAPELLYATPSLPDAAGLAAALPHLDARTCADRPARKM